MPAFAFAPFLQTRISRPYMLPPPLAAIAIDLPYWYDMRYGLLPDKFPARCWAGCSLSLCRTAEMPSGERWRLSGFAVIYWGYRGRREGMGYGDVKYLAALGAWHGWCCRSWRYRALWACFCSGKQALKNPLPFGPFLAAAGLW
jgi:leader peptidase HopD